MKKLTELLACEKCNAPLSFIDNKVICNKCGCVTNVNNNIPRFVSEEYHSNFGYQWNIFSKIQLDSFNGSKESETRLLSQSGLKPQFFKDKVVLEIGSGNGRFTEVLLKYGPKVVSVDYTTAIDANYANNHDTGESLFLQADLFKLPVKKNAFDIVICYGVIQHTGNNKKALESLIAYPKENNGYLLVDIYSSSLRHYNPWIYIIRPIFSLFKMSNENRLKVVSKFVDMVFPVQLAVLKILHNKGGMLKYLRYFINRSPNSVYPINLFLDGKIDKNVAKSWSILDTFDGWAPKHDHPVNRKEWLKMINSISSKTNCSISSVDESGQGYTAVLNRNTL